MSEQERNQILNTWLKDHQGLIFKIVRSFAFEAADQEDLFQEISIRIWRSISKFKGESAVSTWLYRIALNTAISWSRKQQKHDVPKQPVEGLERVLTENDQRPDERLQWLYSEIANLNEIDRSIALLMLDGFSYKEMANMLGISATNLGVKVHRIKQHLIAQSEKLSYHGI